MRRRLVRVLATAGLAAVLLTAGGCRQMTDFWGWCCLSGDLIDYEQYLSIDQEANPKPSVDDVISRLGSPASVHDRDGARIRLDYHAYSLNDELKRAQFFFDKNEKLLKKELW
jgi:hypothetical protein